VGKFGCSYDVTMGKYVDMIKSGIVDPLKVARTSVVEFTGDKRMMCCSRTREGEGLEVWDGRDGGF